MRPARAASCRVVSTGERSSSHGISGAVAVDGEPLALDNALSDERYDPQVDCVPGLQTRSMLVVPVMSSKPNAAGRYGVVALNG